MEILLLLLLQSNRFNTYSIFYLLLQSRFDTISLLFYSFFLLITIYSQTDIIEMTGILFGFRYKFNGN